MKYFKEYIYRILDKKHKGTIGYSEKKARIESLLAGNSTKLYALTFFDTINAIDDDIDKASKALFKQHKWKKLNKAGKDDNKFKRLISKYINSQKEVSDAAGIEKARFNRLINGKFADAYAYEIYGLAMALELQPSEVFQELYGSIHQS